MEAPDTILAFWFGRELEDTAVAAQYSSLWWEKNAKLDAAIRRRFAPITAAAAAGHLNAWGANPEGMLALILLTDQFPRNMYRDTPDAFATDPVARSVCLEGLQSRNDRELRPIQRVFFYLPLEHSEDLEHQYQCVNLFRELAAEVPTDRKPLFEGYLDYAIRHQAIISQFGRFPHRNTILGRPSTPEEITFLQQPGSSF